MAWPLSLGPVCSGNGMFFMFKENPVLATFFAKKTKLIVFRYVAGCFCAGVFFCIRMFSLHEGPWISLVEGGWKSPWSLKEIAAHMSCRFIPNKRPPFPIATQVPFIWRRCHVVPPNAGNTPDQHTATILWWSQLPFPLMQLSLTKSNTSVPIATILPFSLRFQWLSQWWIRGVFGIWPQFFTANWWQFDTFFAFPGPWPNINFMVHVPATLLLNFRDDIDIFKIKQSCWQPDAQCNVTIKHVQKIALNVCARVVVSCANSRASDVTWGPFYVNAHKYLRIATKSCCGYANVVVPPSKRADVDMHKYPWQCRICWWQWFFLRSNRETTENWFWS